jgi:ribosome maturation factor RimP
MQGHPQLFALIESSMPAFGLELVDVEVSDRGLVRVFIDRPNRAANDRTQGITIDDCANVSHHLTRLFMVENVSFERLEVSSPGVDRPLRTPRDFARFAGERAKIRLLATTQNRRNFEGVLAGVQADTVILEVEGTSWRLPLADIERARLIVDLDFRPEGKKKPARESKAPAAERSSRRPGKTEKIKKSKD